MFETAGKLLFRPRCEQKSYLISHIGLVFWQHFHRVIPNFMDQFGCPYAKDPNSPRAGTGGPDPGTSFKGCDGNTYKRNSGGNIPDEVGKDHQRITNAPGTLSMANTGRPESGG